MQLKKQYRAVSRYHLRDRKCFNSVGFNSSILSKICIILMFVLIFSIISMPLTKAEHVADSSLTKNHPHDRNAIRPIIKKQERVNKFQQVTKSQTKLREYDTSGTKMADGSEFYSLAQFVGFPEEKLVSLSSRAKAIRVVIDKYPIGRSKRVRRLIRNILSNSERKIKAAVSKRKTQESDGSPTDVEDIEVVDEELEAKHKHEDAEEAQDNSKTEDDTETPNVNYKAFDTSRALKSKLTARKLVKTSFYPPGNPDRLYSDALLVYVKDFTTQS